MHFQFTCHSSDSDSLVMFNSSLSPMVSSTRFSVSRVKGRVVLDDCHSCTISQNVLLSLSGLLSLISWSLGGVIASALPNSSHL